MSKRAPPEGTVTVLFTDLVESTRLNQLLGDDVARQISRRVEEVARAAVANNRGVLIKEMGDGLMAAFSSARRAIAASVEIQVAMRRLHRDGLDASVQMRIGLHTGEVIDEDGDIHGETVIIAKRIEGLAPPGGILASDTVHGVLGTARDELVDHGVTRLKGIDAEWRMWLVLLPMEEAVKALSPVLADSAPTPYVGRVDERDRLRALLAAAAAGQGGMALIGGPAGLGKSRLAREAKAWAEQLGMTVYVGNCLDMDSPPPYQPAIDHLEHAARNASPAGFRGALGVNAPEVAKLLPSLRQRYDDIPASPDLTPEQERRYMLHGVGEFIERAATNQPMVLVYEDLHWADESTLLLIRHLGSRLSSMPLLVIGTYRDDELVSGRPLTTAIGPLLRDVGAADIRLRLLRSEEVDALLSARAGSDTPRELTELVYAETQGNPFFVEELFRHLRDAGRLFDADGRWRSGFEIGETEVPHGVRLVIGRRLDQLHPDHRKLLASAAVIGRTFSFGHLAAISGTDEDALFDALEAAERAHVIEELPTDHPADYLFVHEQIRQTLLGELSVARRQRIHVRIADAMEAAGQPSAVELAHHLQSAGNAAPAVRTVAALITAANANIASLAFADALRHIDNAAARMDGDGQYELSRLRAGALRGAGRMDEALAVLDRELARTTDAPRQSTLRLQRVQLLNDQYRAAEGLGDVEALVAAAARADDPELSIAVQLVRGRAHYILSLDRPGHAEIARDAYLAAYDAAKERGDTASMIRALLATRWFTDYWVDYRPTALRNVTEALALSRVLGDEDLILDALAASLQTIDRFDIRGAEDVLARLEKRRDPVRLNAHCFWMMWQYLSAGRFAEAVATCDRGIALADLSGSAPVQYGSIKAIALTEMGRYDEVAAAIDQEVTDDGHPFGQAMAALARSVYLTRLAAWGPAAESWTDTLGRAGQLVRVWMQFWAGGALAVVAVRCGSEIVGTVPEPDAIASFGEWTVGLTAAEVALAEGDFARAAELALPLRPRAGATPIADHARALDVLAQAYLGLGQHADALDAAKEGLAMSEPMGFATLVWRVRSVCAAALAGLAEDDLAASAADTAASEFRTLAARITEPEQRKWFLRQPLAPEPD